MTKLSKVYFGFRDAGAASVAERRLPGGGPAAAPGGRDARAGADLDDVDLGLGAELDRGAGLQEPPEALGHPAPAARAAR